MVLNICIALPSMVFNMHYLLAVLTTRFVGIIASHIVGGANESDLPKAT